MGAGVHAAEAPDRDEERGDRPAEWLPSPRDELEAKAHHQDRRVEDEQDRVPAGVAGGARVLGDAEHVWHGWPDPDDECAYEEIPAAGDGARDEQAPRMPVQEQDDREDDAFREQPERSADLPVEIEDGCERPHIHRLGRQLDRGVQREKRVRVGDDRQRRQTVRCRRIRADRHARAGDLPEDERIVRAILRG